MQRVEIALRSVLERAIGPAAVASEDAAAGSPEARAEGRAEPAIGRGGGSKVPPGVAPGAAAVAGTAWARTGVVVAGVRKGPPGRFGAYASGAAGSRAAASGGSSSSPDASGALESDAHVSDTHMAYAAPAVTADTRFDLASLTKVVATLPSILALVADGAVELDDPVRRFFGNAGWFQEPTLADATVRDLLGHTSGLPAWKPVFAHASTRLTALANVLQTNLEAVPGVRIAYSDLGYIVLGAIVERVSGARLDAFATERVFAPLGMGTLAFRPVERGAGGPSAPARAPARTSAGAPAGTSAGAPADASSADRHADPGDARGGPEPADPAFAATEDCGWRGMLLEGVVHDENAWTMDGVAGHAGLFGAADDLATYAQAWLRAVSYGRAGAWGAGRRGAAHGADVAGAPPASDADVAGQGARAAGRSLPFPPSLAREAVREHAHTPEVRRGLGWQLASSASAAGARAGPRSFGHTGFTGTSIWIDPDAGWFAVLLTNRVHPSRERGAQIGTLRAAFHDAVALAVAEVEP